MQKRTFLLVVTFLIGMLQANLYAQTRTVTGVVTDKETNEPLIGVNVLLKGTTNGIATDFDGRYSIQVTDQDVLVFSYVSMRTVEEPVKGRSVINVKMSADAELLGEVVVTAMGIQRQSESLTYAAQTVGGKDVNDIKSVNMINSLQGKSAGLMITPNSTGAGGSSKILFRGNKSISGNNQPLVVVDGVPVMSNVSGQQVASDYGGERDGGDVMSTINPDDIASITLLKGASAAALYGAVAANGAIMITTKSAQSGKVAINISSNTTMETPMVLPKFQNKYGVSDDGTFSWGEKLASEAPNYAKEFYRVGFTTNNSISLAGGNENIQSYFSYGNVYSEGMTPDNNYRSHNLSAKVGFDLFKAIHVDFSAKYNNQYVKNQAAAGFLHNPLVGAYLFPRGEDWDYYKENYEIYDPERGYNVHNWTNTGLQQFTNPYWVLNRQTPISKRDRFEFGGSAKWTITPDWSIQGRMRYELGLDHQIHNFYASSTANLYPMGRMKDNRYFSDQLYGDVLITYNHTFNNEFLLNVTAGSSFTKTKTSHVDLWGEGTKFTGPGNGNIYYPNIFTPNNFYGNMSRIGKNDVWNTEKRLNAVFATVQFGYHDGLFIDASVRNDWSSALAFTESCSFFYPSVGASLLIDKFADMGKNVDLFKLRASYSVVGNDVPLYMSNLRYSLMEQGIVIPPEKAPFRTLKPEKTYSIEAGFEGLFFQGRWNLGLTYYKTNTKNQFFSVAAPYESGLRDRYVNAGNVQNQGFEFTTGWFQQLGKHGSWSTDLNVSYNKNLIVELVDDLPNGLSVAQFGGAKIVLKEGGSYGDLYVRHLLRDEETGALLINEKTGTPMVGGEGLEELEHVGNMNADVHAGWTNTFRYKDFTFSFLIDAKFGGKVMSMTEATLDGWGVSQRTADARDAGKFVFEGNSYDPKAWFTTVGASNFNSPYASEMYVYDATNVRLRELSIGYTFRNLFGTGKNLTASLIGRNLFFFYKDAPMDPDVSAGTGNGVQGIDMFALPTSRSFGLNLKLNF